MLCESYVSVGCIATAVSETKYGGSLASVAGILIVCVAYVYCIFFFSSRRRHTRFDCDWSSDVCSSDLSWQTLFFLFCLAAGDLKRSVCHEYLFVLAFRDELLGTTTGKPNRAARTRQVRDRKSVV